MYCMFSVYETSIIVCIDIYVYYPDSRREAVDKMARSKTDS